jgi:hypothetical protein
MTDTNRDLWSWAELSVSVVSGIAIPLLLGYFGWQYRLDQKEARNTDRIRNATELLASEHWRERVMGVRFMWHYCAENQQYPDPSRFQHRLRHHSQSLRSLACAVAAGFSN